MVLARTVETSLYRALNEAFVAIVFVEHLMQGLIERLIQDLVGYDTWQGGQRVLCIYLIEPLWSYGPVATVSYVVGHKTIDRYELTVGRTEDAFWGWDSHPHRLLKTPYVYQEYTFGRRAAVTTKFNLGILFRAPATSIRS
jgi:hypothetical protein